MTSAPTKRSFSIKFLSCFTTLCFLFTSIISPVQAQLITDQLPVPGTMLNISEAFTPVLIKGMTVNLQNPFQFDFIVHPGDTGMEGDVFKAEAQKLVTYFLAALTVPEDQLWVNLSPYEKNRIIPEHLGKTDMGYEMLAQDYILKQLTASLMYPEGEVGKKFWNEVYAKAAEQGITDVPMDTFNKVWIVPNKVTIYEHENHAFIVDNTLKVMLESDYLAQQNSQLSSSNALIEDPVSSDAKSKNKNDITAQDAGSWIKTFQDDSMKNLVRSVIIPVIEKEVNEGKNFAPLRQIYNGMLLAAWYKKRLKESVLGQVYADKNKVAGIDTVSSSLTEAVWNRYVEAFQKGAYNYIGEDYDPAKNEVVSKKYFSGGLRGLQVGEVGFTPAMLTPAQVKEYAGSYEASVDFASLTTAVDTHRTYARTALGITYGWEHRILEAFFENGYTYIVKKQSIIFNQAYYVVPGDQMSVMGPMEKSDPEEVFKKLQVIAGFKDITEDIRADKKENKKTVFDGAMLFSETKEQLAETAAKMVPPDGGILAADESFDSAGSRLKMVGLENTLENQEKMRQLMLTAPGLFEAGIKAVILFSQTFENTDKDGNNLVRKYLIGNQIQPGIKTDKGLHSKIADQPLGEQIANPKGLEELPEMLKKFKALEAAFTKWRTVLHINSEIGFPTNENIDENAEVQAEQARLTQEAVILPLVEPEVMNEKSNHNLQQAYEATVRVLSRTFDILKKRGVWLPGMILKTSMILSGKDYGNQQLADYQVKRLGLDWESISQQLLSTSLVEKTKVETAIVLKLNVKEDYQKVKDVLQLDDKDFNRLWEVIKRALATDREGADTVGFYTLKGLLKSVPSEVPAIVFLSGGQGDEQVLDNTDAVIRASRDRFIEARDAVVAELEAEGNFERAAEVRTLTKIPWEISYSFGRGLQRPALLAWEGKDENWKIAQDVMVKTAKATQSARLGQRDKAMLFEESGALIVSAKDSREGWYVKAFAENGIAEVSVVKDFKTGIGETTHVGATQHPQYRSITVKTADINFSDGGSYEQAIENYKELSDKASLSDESESDAAMNAVPVDTVAKNGGIDFNAAGVNMDIQMNSDGFVFPKVDPAMMEKFQINGLQMNVIQFRPLGMPVLREMIGLAPDPSDKDSDMSYHPSEKAIRQEIAGVI